MTLSEAKLHERNNEIEKATIIYENIIKKDRGNIEALLNLIVLHWLSAEIGFSSGHHLSTAFVQKSGVRLKQLLTQGKITFPYSPEITFWEKYIAWVDWGEEFSIAECEKMLENFPNYLEPIVFLISMKSSQYVKDKAVKLLNILQNDHSQRGRYVFSVIDSYLSKSSSQHR